MGFVYRNITNSKNLVNHFVWNHQYFEKFEEEKICPLRILLSLHSSLSWSFIAYPQSAF